MTERVFLDANVLVYLSGAEHPLKRPSLDVFRLIGTDPSSCWTSAEVLQELLHVFLRRSDLERAKAVVGQFVTILGNQVVPLMADDVLWCLQQPLPGRLQARDRIHLAVMARLGITRIITTDRSFDEVPGVLRLAPELLPEWRASVFGA